jgi:dihydrofolate synthase/folylpolyglutamate synthase
MDRLGNPQNKLKVIHIAGTSGKTSTAYYVAALIKGTGKKVGLTISPHIVSINERTQINVIPLPETEYCRELGVFLDIIERTKLKPSYFELLVAFAYWQFERQAVDYAVVEVGLGGLLDGTNVVSREDKVCMITDIGYDHMNRLGSTLKSIANQKAGIIQKNNEVFFHKQSSEIINSIIEVCKAENATAHEIKDYKVPNKLDFLPLFQQRNFNLALEVYGFLVRRDGLPGLIDNQILLAAHTNIPGRMEIFRRGNKTIILDGAHNSQKLHALVSSIQAKYPNVKASILFSLSSNQKGTIEAIEPIAKHLIFTSIKTYQDEKKRSPRRILITDQLTSAHISYEIDPNPELALEKLLNRPEELLVITGSFYLLNTIRPLILSM